jgi:hypothetical protein
MNAGPTGPFPCGCFRVPLTPMFPFIRGFPIGSSRDVLSTGRLHRGIVEKRRTQCSNCTKLSTSLSNSFSLVRFFSTF